MFLSDVSERRSNVLLLFCMFALERLGCRHVLFIPFLSEWMEVQEDLFVTFGQCISRQTEIKKRRYESLLFFVWNTIDQELMIFSREMLDDREYLTDFSPMMMNGRCH